MSTAIQQHVIEPPVRSRPGGGLSQGRPTPNYLNQDHSLKSWLLTQDHKRIAILYLIGVSFFFVVAVCSRSCFGCTC